MAALPDDIWRIITKYLPSKALRNFNSSHRHAQEILGESRVQKLKLWDPIFRDYEWVDIAKTFLGTPGLLFINDGVDKPYVYLFFTAKTSGVNRKLRPLCGPPLRRKEEVLIDKVKLSLRSASPGKHDYEVDFKDFILNISSIRCERFLLCKNLAQKFSTKSLVTSIYGERSLDIKPRVVNDVLAGISIPGFQSLTFYDA